ncbi:MAG: hypothetical protein Q8N65_03090 [bacterium]|nr:hypothetical protein [bacterium]
MEDKKFFDIIPPGRREESQEEGLLKPKPVEKPKGKLFVKKEVIEEETSSDLIPRIPFPKAKVLVLSVFLLFFGLIGVAVYLKLPNVDIDIWLKTENLTFTIPAEVNKEIPGKIISEEQFLSQEFSSTGKAVKEEKSEGTVRIFNDYSTSSQSLIAATRFVSSEGKLFRLVERVAVPGQTMEKGKLVPGTVDALVRADVTGQEYNIGPSAFSIPGFAGTPKYTFFYAKSFSAMKGGFRGETLIVSAEDLEKARQVTRAKIEEKIDNALNNRTLPGLLLVKENVSLNIPEQGPTAKVGDAVKTFNYQIRAKKETILLAEDDLRTLVQTDLLSKLEDQQRFLPESIQINPSIETIDTATGKTRLSLKISVKIYTNLEAGPLKEQLSEKSIQEVQQSFQNLSQVSRAKIKIFPSFFKNLPKDLNKIELNISFE